MGIAQLVPHKAGESVLCVKGDYAALHKLFWWHCGEKRTALFLLCMSAKFVVMCPSVRYGCSVLATE